MKFTEILLIGAALSMDAFAACICKGLSMKKLKAKNLVIIPLFVAFFHWMMPNLGYLGGTYAKKLIEQFDHWIAFILLLIIGANMIREAFSEDEDFSDGEFRLNYRELIMLCTAVSIDALVIGIALAMEDVSIASASLVIGVTAGVISAAGLIIGNRIGTKFEKGAEVAGGAVLILIGLKTLLEHLGILNL